MEVSREKFWDKHDQEARSRSNQCRFSSLMKIEEVIEWSSSGTNTIKICPPKKEFMKKHRRILGDSPNLSENSTVAYFQKFLMKLQKNLQVYEYFLSCGVCSRILTPSVCLPSLYYYKHIHYSNQDKFCKKPRGQSFNEYGLDSVNLGSENLEETFVYPAQTGGRIQELSLSLRAETEPSSYSKPKRKALKAKTKRTVINRQNEKIAKTFQKMCAGQHILLKSCRLTNALFKQFIQKKFNDMSDAICKYFDFKSANFEEYLSELDRLLLARDEKHLAMCFEAFDFNKDKYICFQDAYIAIESRTENLYDSDLVKLQSMMEMKKKGIYPLRRSMSKRGRRSSITSRGSDFSVFEAKKKEILPVHPAKPEALTFEDFCRIEFKGKPQLICSLIQYLCNYDANSCQEITTPVCKSRRPSEDLVYDSSFREIEDKTVLEYFSELEVSIRMFDYDDSKDLLSKFELLRDKHHTSNVITKASMAENWEKLFGACHKYVSERFYYYFSGQLYREVNKLMYLQRIHLFLNDENEQKQFPFKLYDARADNKLTSDEVYRFEQCLPNNSPIHHECSL